MVRKTKDLTGQTFGSLTAIQFSYMGANNMAYWEYQCVCGKPHIARSNTIRYEAKKGDPQIPSCGCIELSRKTKHGFRKAQDTHPLYKVYRSMMDRCYNPNSPAYQWYGAIGVTMHPDWKDNPVAFIEWGLANGWEPNTHIDKDILSDKLGIHPHVYGPKTCQWVSAKVNVGYATNRDNFGKHPNVRLSHKQVEEILNYYFSGEITNKSELARMYGVHCSSIRRLIRIAEGAE